MIGICAKHLLSSNHGVVLVQVCLLLVVPFAYFSNKGAYWFRRGR